MFILSNEVQVHDYTLKHTNIFFQFLIFFYFKLCAILFGSMSVLLLPSYYTCIHALILCLFIKQHSCTIAISQSLGVGLGLFNQSIDAQAFKTLFWTSFIVVSACMCTYISLLERGQPFFYCSSYALNTPDSASSLCCIVPELCQAQGWHQSLDSVVLCPEHGTKCRNAYH